MSIAYSTPHSPAHSPSSNIDRSYDSGVGASVSSTLNSSGWQVWEVPTDSAHVSSATDNNSNDIIAPEGFVNRENWKNVPRQNCTTRSDMPIPVVPLKRDIHQDPRSSFNSREVGMVDGRQITDDGSSALKTPRSPVARSATLDYTAHNGPVYRNVSGGRSEIISPLPEELSVAMRGMAVEDENRSIAQRQPPLPHLQESPTFYPPPIPPHPPAYSIFPQPDFSNFYPIPPHHEQYVDPMYGLGNHSDPSSYALSPPPPANMYPRLPPPQLGRSGVQIPSHHNFPAGVPHANLVMDVPQQPGFFYDVHPPPSRFFYGPPLAFSHFPQPHLITTPVGQNVHTGIPGTKGNTLYYETPQPPHSNQPLQTMLPNSHISPATSESSLVSLGNPPSSIPFVKRSTILEEFRLNKIKDLELTQIVGHIGEFSRDQHGSRYIQQKLELATDKDRQIIFEEIVPMHCLQLMQDVFGNYVIQRLLEFGSKAQKDALVSTMGGYIIQLSLQVYGCRVIQKTLEKILPEQQSVIVRELEPHILRCVKDPNGNHVIQKLFQTVPPDLLRGVMNSFRGNVYDLSSHPYGCRVLQRCLEHMPEHQIRPLMEELMRSAPKLMTNQFGNYVMQFILEHGRPHEKLLVVSKIRGHLLHLAKHKFASNVCEKALLFSDSDSRRSLIDEIITLKPDGFNPMLAMMKDQYANYVLQRALSVSEGEQREALFSKVKPLLAQMRKFSTPYGKHLNSIERQLEKHMNNSPKREYNATTIS